MASPQVVSVDWGDLVVTTMEARGGAPHDNMSNNNALYAILNSKNKIRYVTGGREMYENVAYAENQSGMWYQGTEMLNIALNDTMTAARYQLKQFSVAVVLSGLESLMNTGEEEALDLIEQRIDIAEKTYENHMSAGVYSDGTGYAGKQIGGLGLFISKAPTSGLVGGLDRAANAWWRNLSINSNLDARGVVSASNIVSYMNSATINSKRGSDGIDLIVCDTNYYSYYLQNLQSVQRIVSEGDGKKIGSGFMSLAYYGAGKEARVVLDGGKNGQIPPNTMYFINTDYISFRPHRDRNFKVVGGERSNINQDAIVKLALWAGNMTCSNLSLNAVLWN